MSGGARDPGPGEKGGTRSPRPVDEKKIVVEFTRSFNSQFEALSSEIQEKCRRTIEIFIDSYLLKQFPKSLRVHKCGSFLSLSVTMSHRIFVLPIQAGIKFVFVGDHNDAARYLRRT